MNLSALVELTHRIDALDSEWDLTGDLSRLNQAINAMANNPGDQNAQSNFANAKSELTDGIRAVEPQLSPADLSRLEILNGREFFTFEMMEKIERSIQDNPAAPAVIKSTVDSINQQRQAFLGSIRSLNSTLNKLEFEPELVEEREVQIGFTIPRDLFENNFSGLLSELHFIKLFVRQFSEIEGEDPEDISVGQISTTDPIFWLIAAYAVVSAVGKVTTWALNTWKTSEEIRKLRREAEQNGSFSQEEIEQFFDKKIESMLDDKIAQKAKELTADFDGPKGRKNELENGLGIQLRQFLARIERGMTVEVKLLEPPKAENDDEEKVEENEAKMAVADAIKAIATQLVFPKPSGSPILSLTDKSEKSESEDKN